MNYLAYSENRDMILNPRFLQVSGQGTWGVYVPLNKVN